MSHRHYKHKTLEMDGIKFAECICGARKLMIEGDKTDWIEGYYANKVKK